MKLLVLLDFDGVIFNSAYEAYQVCQEVAKTNPGFRRSVNFDEFMDFRRYVTNAWQFNRLYSKELFLNDFSKLTFIRSEQADQIFADLFFKSRKHFMEDNDWVKLMSPYSFFHELKKLILTAPHVFKILSTRDEASIKRTLEFYSLGDIQVYGQESLIKYGSKHAIAKSNKWLEDYYYTVYVDDMNSHLEPFQGDVDLCVHAGWGYDFSNYESYTETQAFNMISGFVKLAGVIKND